MREQGQRGGKATSQERAGPPARGGAVPVLDPATTLLEAVALVASVKQDYTRGPDGVREISATISPTAFSLAAEATSACARTPTRLLSSSTTGRRRT